MDADYKIAEANNDSNGLISVYDTPEEIKVAVKQLHHADFDMTKLTVVARDTGAQEHEQIVRVYNIGQRTKYWATLGALMGTICGLLFGSALFVIPGVGPFVVARTFKGAAMAGNLSTLGSALLRIGIPRNSILNYEAALKSGKFVVIAHGTAEVLNESRKAVRGMGAKSILGFDSKNMLKEKL